MPKGPRGEKRPADVIGMSVKVMRSPTLLTHVAQHGSGIPVVDWARLLRCTKCGGSRCRFCGDRRAAVI